MRKKLFCSSVVVAASLFASSANAAEFITISGPSGNFGNDSVTCPSSTVPCTFTDRLFNFVTPAGFNLASIVISTVASTNNPLTNIDFGINTFNGVNLANGPISYLESSVLLN